jgi:hypothetical protein
MNELPAPLRADEFSFVLLADRTGMARPGVFERAIEVTNLLRPAFAIQLGDTVEGYSDDPGEIAGMWDEVDAITAKLEVPYLRIPGNHDVSNPLMRRIWLERNGQLHYHFRFDDVLFLMVDTQDPPLPLIECLRPVDAEARRAMPLELADFVDGLQGRPDPEVITAIAGKLEDDPELIHALLRAIKSGTQPARIGAKQITSLIQAVTEHDDVRWTVVCMHMPAWQGDSHPALDLLRATLARRPYTAFAGHCHNYQHSTIDERDHIRLGTSGGLRVLEGQDGDFDHVTLVTMTAAGPRIANIAVDAVVGPEGGAFLPAPLEASTS